MKVAGVRELRADLKRLLGAAEPVIVTRHGRVSGLFLPLDEPDRIPDDLRRDVVRVLGAYLRARLRAAGVREADVLADFHVHRRGRRRR